MLGGQRGATIDSVLISGIVVSDIGLPQVSAQRTGANQGHHRSYEPQVVGKRYLLLLWPNG